MLLNQNYMGHGDVDSVVAFLGVCVCVSVCVPVGAVFATVSEF